MNNQEIEQIEISLLLEAIYLRYGYDFQQYARASISRRIKQALSTSGCKTLSEMTSRVLRDEDFFTEVAYHFSISVTEMFRDPFVYLSIREQVVPFLRTWPFVKIWHAGCATGEEVYSLAIILKEEGLLDRATIYATDFNDAALKQAREGIFKTEKIKNATQNYQVSGGKASFSEYYHARYEAAMMNNRLKDRLTFANHNLVIDSIFGEFQLVFCRNVLIYFNRELQNRVLKLFTESLAHGGFLCLGTKETLDSTAVSGFFTPVDKKARIYRKTAGI